MDLGVVSLEGLVSSDPESKNKWYNNNGSGLLKQERSGTCTEDELRSFKLAKTDQQVQNRNSCSASLLRSNATTTLFSSDGQQQMLSFSTPTSKSESFLVDKTTQNAALSYAASYHPMSSYNRNTGTTFFLRFFFIIKIYKLKGCFFYLDIFVYIYEYILYPLWGAKKFIRLL